MVFDNRVWIGCRNGISFGRWDHNNPMVLAPTPLKQKQYYVVAGRMGAGVREVQIEAFVNSPTPAASKPFPVNPQANSSKLAIGQERDATGHPGKESFDGEISRFLLYERPLTNDELRHTLEILKKRYAIEEAVDRPHPHDTQATDDGTSEHPLAAHPASPER